MGMMLEGSSRTRPQLARGAALAVALLALMVLTPAAGAQDFDGTIGYGGGGVWFGDFDDQGSLALKAGWLGDVHVERWYANRLGVRAHAAFTRRPLEMPGDTRDINTWMIDGGALLHLLPPRPDRSVVPFVSAGAGVVSYGLGEGRKVTISDEIVYSGDDDRQFTAIAGIGVDLLPEWDWLDTRLGVRLEVADHVVFESPFEPRAGGSFGPIHNIRATLSLLGLVDLFP